METTQDDTEGISSSIGRRAFIAGGVGALAGASVLSSAGRVAAAAVEPGASYLVPIDPVRLCDTREPWRGVGFTRVDGTTIRVSVCGALGIPGNAVAVVLTVTGVNLINGGNWISAYPAGSPWPGTSSSNSEYYDQRVANLVTVKVGSNGQVDFKSLASSHVVVDISGYYLPTSVPVRAGRFVPVSPFRVVDTRNTGRRGAGDVMPINMNGRVPSDAVAVVVNLTAVDTSTGGFIAAYPLGTEWPGTSNLNHDGWDVRASAAVVKLRHAFGMLGFNLYTLSATDIVVDVAGYITGVSAPESSDGLFVPINPIRIGDTRYLSRRIWPGSTATFSLPAPMNQRASAVAMNVTVTGTIGGGYFTTYAAQTARQVVSSLNVVRAGQTIANHAFSRVSAAGVASFSQSGAHIIADVSGWFTGPQAPITTAPPYNPPPPGGPIPWIVSIPRLGLNQWVFDGDANWIVNSGNTWHWTGTGLVGEGTHVVLFGHRTEHGGPYRYQHNLRAGDKLHIHTSDGRRYNYQLVAEYLSSSAPSDILGKTRLVGGETVSIVACTKLNRLPTDKRYRLISTFALLGWDDLV